MVRVKRDQYFVWPDRYYVWTYFPKKYRKSVNKVGKNTLYAKHYTCVPYMTRQHAKHVVTYYYGVRALHYIHIIHGSRLIKQGITTFNRANGQKDYQKHCFLKGAKGEWFPAYLKQWAYPPEYMYDSHRRRRYIVNLNRVLGNGKKLGRKRFNRLYTKYNLGNRYRRISSIYFRHSYIITRKKVNIEVYLEDLQQEINDNLSNYPITLLKCKLKGIMEEKVSEKPIKIKSQEEFNTLLEEVKQFNHDPFNIRKEIYITIKTFNLKVKTMAKKKQEAKAKEVSRIELGNGSVLVKYDDGSYAILSVTTLSKEQVEEIFGSSEEEDDEEEEEDDEEEDEDDEEEDD